MSSIVFDTCYDDSSQHPRHRIEACQLDFHCTRHVVLVVTKVDDAFHPISCTWCVVFTSSMVAKGGGRAVNPGFHVHTHLGEIVDHSLSFFFFCEVFPPRFPTRSLLLIIRRLTQGSVAVLPVEFLHAR